MYIYKTEILETNEVYVGQCSRSSSKTANYLGSGTVFKRKVDKYGKENCKKIILLDEIDTREDLDFYEKVFIKLAKLKYKDKCLNLAEGGEGRSHSEEEKKLLSERMKGNTIMRGRTLSDATKKKMGEAHKGNTVMLGRTLSEETKRKMGEAHKGNKNNLGRIPNKETREKMSKAHTGIPHTEEVKKKLSILNTGKKATEETKKKLSESHKGQVAWNKGKKGSIPWNKGKTNIYSEETKDKIREGLIKYNKERKEKIIQQIIEEEL